jgi:hypothetical protein
MKYQNQRSKEKDLARWSKQDLRCKEIVRILDLDNSLFPYFVGSCYGQVPQFGRGKDQDVASVSKSTGAEKKLPTHQPLKS